MNTVSKRFFNFTFDALRNAPGIPRDHVWGLIVIMALVVGLVLVVQPIFGLAALLALALVPVWGNTTEKAPTSPEQNVLDALHVGTNLGAGLYLILALLFVPRIGEVIPAAIGAYLLYVAWGRFTRALDTVKTIDAWPKPELDALTAEPHDAPAE